MKRIAVLFFIALFTSCATYYTRNFEFNQQFQRGELELANKTLDKDKKAEKRKTKLLFYLNKGVVLQMQGDYELSNQYFEKAYIYTEDYSKNTMAQAASFLTNPNITEYKAEDHEALYINYYKALNYFYLQNFDAALVECKRMNIRLNQQQDKYKNKKRFQRDAFIHLLMGIIYEAQNDLNNAFIAYRNSLEIYKDDYARLFGMSVPEQLKLDIMRTAYMMGFTADLIRYEEEFDLKYTHQPKNNEGDLVFLWHNGLGPIKSEWSINFTVVPGSGGSVVFANEELGLNFNFPSSSNGQNGSLSDLSLLRVAFPKYTARQAVFHEASITVGDKSKKLSLAEDVNQIAIKGLEDRMMQELGTSLLRLALKKAAEITVRNQNEGLGMLMSVANAVTEKADTRNWQTIPHDIHYTRMSVPEGEHAVQLNMNGNYASKQEIPVSIQKNRTVVKGFTSLEFVPSATTQAY